MGPSPGAPPVHRQPRAPTVVGNDGPGHSGSIDAPDHPEHAEPAQVLPALLLCQELREVGEDDRDGAADAGDGGEGAASPPRPMPHCTQGEISPCSGGPSVAGPPLPHAREQAAEEEGAIALDEGGEEGEDAVDGEGDEEALPSAQPVGQPAPHERAHHHAQVHDESWGGGHTARSVPGDPRTCTPSHLVEGEHPRHWGRGVGRDPLLKTLGPLEGKGQNPM